MRLIDADALRKRFEVPTLDCLGMEPTFMDDEVKDEIDNAPTVDAVPVVHGRWIEVEDGWGDYHYQCTECGEEWNLDAGTPAENNMNFCPNCGAKMDAEVTA